MICCQPLVKLNFIIRHAVVLGSTDLPVKYSELFQSKQTAAAESGAWPRLRLGAGTVSCSALLPCTQEGSELRQTKRAR